jgi:hypothetical protein
MPIPQTKYEDWINRKWRPLMGYMYMIVCVFDFIIFPIFWASIQLIETHAAASVLQQWQPITLQGAGLFHMAMGAVLGIAAWSRGQEKISGVNYEPVSYQQTSYQPVYTTNATYMTRSGKVAPVLEEPLL